MDYENENDDYSEDYQEDEDYTEIKKCDSEDQDENLQAEEEIDEYELSCLEEDMK